jgi:hypothetical protein
VIGKEFKVQYSIFDIQVVEGSRDYNVLVPVHVHVHEVKG